MARRPPKRSRSKRAVRQARPTAPIVVISPPNKPMLFAYMRVLDPFVIVRHSPDGMGGG